MKVRKLEKGNCFCMYVCNKKTNQFNNKLLHCNTLQYIASVCNKKTIQFNNKWKSTDLILFNLNVYVLRNCFDFFQVGRVFYFILFVLLVYVFIYLHIFGWVSGEFFFYSSFLNFILKLVMLMLNLNSCKIYLFKVVVLYCVVLF